MPIWIDGYPFDIAVHQGSAYPGEVTEHPVDADADVSDHIRLKATELTLECVVSNTPIGDIANHESRRDVPLAGEAAFDKLLEIRAKRKAVTVETPRRTYLNMGFTNLERNEDVESSGGVLFTVSFQQIKFLQNKRITVRAVPIVKGKADLGTKQPKKSKLVERRVDAHDGTWYDPDINSWREGASFNTQTNQWEYFKGTPVGQEKGLSDDEYRRRIANDRDAGLVNVNKKGVPTGANPGRFLMLPGEF